MGYAARPIAERFWPKVAIRGPNDCWEWMAAKINRGYGVIGAGGKRGGNLLAHRVSFLIEHGYLPPDLDVLHACDNPPCVNPGHLFLGTTTANMADMRAKGRSCRGTMRSDAKLTEEAVVEIRRLRAQGGVTLRELGAPYGVCEATVHNAISGKRWRHVA